MERHGKVVPGLRWNPLCSDQPPAPAASVQFEPGGVSVPPRTPGARRVYVLDGEFCDHDGTHLPARQFVSLTGTPALLLLRARRPHPRLADRDQSALHHREALSFGPDTVGQARFSDNGSEAPVDHAPGQHRLVEVVNDLEFTPFDRYGDEVAKLFWNPVSFDRGTGKGCFVIRFKPGGVSTPHEHHGMEEFYVLDGTVVDHDGVRYTKGDFVSLGPGVKHYSHSPDGVLVIAWLTGTNRPLTEGEALSFGPDVVNRARYRT